MLYRVWPRLGRRHLLLVQRLDREVPKAIAEHLAGDAVEPSDPVRAADCPPTVVAGHFLDDTALALSLVPIPR